MNLMQTTTPADRLVIAFAIILVASLYAVYWQPSQAGTVVEYHTPNDRGSLRLDTDRKLALQGSNGTSHISIDDGAVRFTDSPCRNKQCIHSGWLHGNGDFAACLPNQVTLRVRAGDEQGFDAINY